METERAAIIELFRNGNTTAQILKALNIPMKRRNFVYRTINRFRETGSLSDKPRSGRPVTATTREMKSAVRSRVWRNPRRSVRKMALELKISRGSLRRIVNRDLGLSSFKRKRVHFLTDKIRAKRLSRSKGLLTRFANQGLEKVLFSDEKLFTVEEASNRQNDRILSTSASAILEEHKFVQRVQKPSSVMVWGGVSAIGRTSLVFIPMGVKINAVTYQNLVLEPVVKDLGVNMFGNQPFLFQQDGAPAHTANSTQEWLRIEIPDFIAKEEWPPSSPDVNPLDFCVWSILETKACSKSHKSIESLKASLVKEWNNIPQETLRIAVEAVPKRLNAIVKKKGGYIE